MTNERTSERTDEKFAEPKRADRVAFVVFAVLAANALTAFAIQAWMTYGFGSEVWKLPTELAVALIVALDVFAIMYMILTYLLRGTGWPRFAATVVFLFAIGAQVFAAELYGDHENWPTEVRWFAALPAVFLALSQEGVILWRTHRNDPTPHRPRKAEPVEQQEPPAKSAPAPVAAPPASAAPVVRKERPEPGKTQVKQAVKTRKDDGGKTERREQLVLDVIAKRKTAVEVAKLEGVSERAVQIWVKNYRERHPAPRGLTGIAMLPTDLTSNNVRPINGAAPEVEVTK